MAESELKPCPFCGGRAEISPVYTVRGKYKNYYTVFCTNVVSCGAGIDGDAYSDEGEAKASAIERWNRRAKDDLFCKR